MPVLELDPPFESEPVVGVNRWLRSRVVLVSFSEGWTSMRNSITKDTGLDAGQTTVAEELHGFGWMLVSRLNPRWMSAFALSRRSLV